MVSAGAAAPSGPGSVWLAGYRAARIRFPPRTRAADWPASLQPREQVHELCGPAAGQAGALGALLDWLQGQDGGSWQQRWLASDSRPPGLRGGSCCPAAG